MDLAPEAPATAEQRPELKDRIKQEPESATAAAASMAAAVAPKPEPKKEPRACAACGLETEEWVEAAAGGALAQLLARLLGGEAVAAASCRGCAALLADLERAEAEYRRLKKEFADIIARNPLHRPPQPPQPAPLLPEVKTEVCESDFLPSPDRLSDSEDEPLAAKRTRVAQTKKKKSKKKGAVVEKKRKSVKKKTPESCEDDEFSLDNYAVKEEIDLPIDDFKDGSILLKMEQEDPAPVDKFPAKRRGRPAGAGRGGGRGAARGAGGAGRGGGNKDMYSCDQCRAKYSSKERLARHLATHGDGPPYICEVCGASYKHRRACEIHVALHKGISKWKCEECNRLFPSKGALERHNNIHTGKLNYQCDLCGKSFIHTSSFKMHKLAHSGVKPHSCHVCGLALMTSSHLKRHLRIHSGEKRYECDHCGRRFSERYNLAAHARSHAPRPEAEGGAPRAFGFRCPYCPERASRKYLLERHVSAAHGRTLERTPARPRNTMSKMLKAQAARSGGTETPEQKAPVGSPPRAEPLKPAQNALSSGVAPGSWGGGFAAEFSRLHAAPYPH